jgi:TPR repeat protein
MHLNGTGTRPDKLAAYFWFRLAEVAGHPTAMKAKQALASQMTNEQITPAAEKASKWLQVHPPRSATSSLRQSVANPK